MKDINKILAKTHFKCKKSEKNPHFCENMSPCHAFTSPSCSLREKSSLPIFCKCGEPCISLFFGPFKPLSAVVDSLFKPSLDEDTKIILKSLCTALKAKCEKLFTDFLEGGKYYEPSGDTVMETESCPPNNITVERLMAKLDLQMKSAPTANIDTIENCVMFCNNNTISWLQNKDRAEQKLVIEQARKQNDTIIKKRKERQEQLQKDHQKCNT
jgi:hypothetical protein